MHPQGDAMFVHIVIIISLIQGIMYNHKKSINYTHEILNVQIIKLAHEIKLEMFDVTL